MLIFVKPDDIPTVDDAVEVGTKIQVGVTATAHDERAGRSYGLVRCGEEGGDGCAAALTCNGISDNIESRWSCATKLVEGGGPCQIEYTFAVPQDIVDIHVAFRKANERARTLEVSERVSGNTTGFYVRPDLRIVRGMECGTYVMSEWLAHGHIGPQCNQAVNTCVWLSASEITLHRMFTVPSKEGYSLRSNMSEPFLGCQSQPSPMKAYVLRDASLTDWSRLVELEQDGSYAFRV